MRKLEIGVQSGNWYDESQPEDSVRFIKECGFEAIDYNINNLFDASFDKEHFTSLFDKSLDELYEYFSPLKKVTKEHEICFSQLHGIFPMYFYGEDARNQYILNVTEKMFAICRYLDCDLIVIHPWSGPDIHKDEEKEINLRMYRQLIPAAKKYGITICLENLFKHYDHDCFSATCTSAEEACWYIDTLNKEAGEELFGFCLDIGHAHVTTQNLYQYITTLGNRLKALHIHDNDGTSDSHMIPYTQMDRTGKRLAIKWDKFIQGLKEIGYEGALSFETFRAIDVLPKELQKEGFRFIRAIGEYFRSCIKGGECC